MGLQNRFHLRELRITLRDHEAHIANGVNKFSILSLTLQISKNIDYEMSPLQSVTRRMIKRYAPGFKTPELLTYTIKSNLINGLSNAESHEVLD